MRHKTLFVHSFGVVGVYRGLSRKQVGMILYLQSLVRVMVYDSGPFFFFCVIRRRHVVEAHPPSNAE